MEMERRDIRKVFSRIGMSLTTLILGNIVFLFLIVLVMAIISPEFAQWVVDSDWAGVLLSYAALYLVALPLALLILRTIPSYPPAPAVMPEIKSVPMLKTICACASLTMIINLVGNGFISLLERLKGSGIENPLDMMIFGEHPFVIFFLVVIVAPVMEEYIFRWVLYKKLAVFGAKTYFVVSALMFALFHMNLFQMIYAFVLGLAFAGMTFYTGRIRYSMIAHAGVNLTGGGISVFVMAYGGEALLALWGLCVLAIIIVGLIILVNWMRWTRMKFYLPPGQVALPNKKVVVCNVGMIIFMALTIGYTIYQLVV